MDKNSNAKQINKKSQMAVDKSKKSASKKKKKVKKSSVKSDRSPDSLEVEGVRAFDQQGTVFIVFKSDFCKKFKFNVMIVTVTLKTRISR